MSIGKNRKISEKLLSIRLCADGLTFWTTALEHVSDGTGSGFKAKPGSDSREETIPFGGKPATSTRKAGNTGTAAGGRSTVSGVGAAGGRSAVSGVGAAGNTGSIAGNAGSVAGNTGSVAGNAGAVAGNAGAAVGDVRAAAAQCAAVTGWTGWPVRVMPDTRKTVLVPSGLFDPSQAANYLKINNITLSPGEQIVLSHLSADVPPAQIIMVYDKCALDKIEEIFGEYVWYTSLFDTATAYAPVKHRKKDAERCFSTLYLTPGNVYITIQNISDGRWLYYEVFPYSTPTDVFYYMKELSSRFDILKTPVYVRGNGSEAVSWVLNELFRKPLCE